MNKITIKIKNNILISFTDGIKHYIRNITIIWSIHNYTHTFSFQRNQNIQLK